MPRPGARSRIRRAAPPISATPLSSLPAARDGSCGSSTFTTANATRTLEALATSSLAWQADSSLWHTAPCPRLICSGTAGILSGRPAAASCHGRTGAPASVACGCWGIQLRGQARRQRPSQRSTRIVVLHVRSRPEHPCRAGKWPHRTLDLESWQACPRPQVGRQQGAQKQGGCDLTREAAQRARRLDRTPGRRGEPVWPHAPTAIAYRRAAHSCTRRGGQERMGCACGLWDPPRGGFRFLRASCGPGATNTL